MAHQTLSNRDFCPAESWRILRIMSEFVESFDTLTHAKELSVSVFGSARTREDEPEYQEACSKYFTVGDKAYRFVPIVSGDLPETECWVLGG